MKETRVWLLGRVSVDVLGGSVNRVRFHSDVHTTLLECPASESWLLELFNVRYRILPQLNSVPVTGVFPFRVSSPGSG